MTGQSPPKRTRNVLTTSPEQSTETDTSDEGDQEVSRGVSEALRLMEEVRDLAPDLREAILRRAFVKPTRQFRSHTRRN